MPNVREILNEVFSLMELQVLARAASTSENKTEEYRQRSERIDELLRLLVDERRPSPLQ
jgi:hypothetical protein